jgi:hypothetical protein
MTALDAPFHWIWLELAVADDVEDVVLGSQRAALQVADQTVPVLRLVSCLIGRCREVIQALDVVLESLGTALGQTLVVGVATLMRS